MTDRPTDYSYVLPEMARRMTEATYLMPGGGTETVGRQPMPTFPAACPACGAEGTPSTSYYDPVSYACGAAYTMKPQIQNHTDKWWGTCPVRKAQIEGAR